MKKILFYAMNGEKMCFSHLLMNALDLHEEGMDVAVIFEGASVKLPPVLEEEENKLYLKAKELGLIAGICLACSNVLGVLEENKKTGLPLLNDMMGHAGVKPYIAKGYEVISF
ncbi:MAG: hypothetical protein GX046_08080 [Tissierellia bacterium]|jgi:hypothetical protein|nr:hypothetical protein [Tissierellia bacterium]